MKQITYNEDSRRLELDGNEFHCGDSLEVLITDDLGAAEWIQTRVEADRRGKWYLVGLSEVEPVGLTARINDK